MAKHLTKAVAYLRTSSAANVGPDKDSDKRQRAAIQAYAKGAGYEIVAEFYDAAVSGADPVGERPGFAAMLEALLANARAQSSSSRQTDSPATSWCSSPATTCWSSAASF